MPRTVYWTIRAARLEYFRRHDRGPGNSILLSRRLYDRLVVESGGREPLQIHVTDGAYYEAVCGMAVLVVEPNQAKGLALPRCGFLIYP